MRKLIIGLSILLTAFVLFGISLAETAATENKAFDRTVYETAENYSYDKFDKTWDVYAAYVNRYNDATVVFGLKVLGGKDSILVPPYLYVWVREANNVDPKLKITGLQIIANDLIFSANELFVFDSYSQLFLDSDKGKQLLNAITKGKELDFKVVFNTGSHVESITGDDYKKIKQLA